MRKILIAFITLSLACSCQHHKEQASGDFKDLETIKNLELVDPASSSLISYPLICVEGGEYPGGVEFIFQKTNDPKKLIHVVFPKEIEAPKIAESEFSMAGRFQSIQNKDRFVHKRPPEDYKYFVVESWSHEN